MKEKFAQRESRLDELTKKSSKYGLNDEEQLELLNLTVTVKPQSVKKDDDREIRLVRYLSEDPNYDPSKVADIEALIDEELNK